MLFFLATELKDVQSQLARESLTRQVAERTAKTMEEELVRLQKSLEDRDGQLQASASTAEQYLKELDALRLRYSATQATADAGAAFAQSAHLQCFSLVKELEEKNSNLKEHEDGIVRLRLGEQLDHLQKDLQGREVSEKQCRDEEIDKFLTGKDEEVSKLRDEIRIMSAHWKLKTKELESQSEKHYKADQELKKRVLKLEFCLQETCCQTRKLQRMGERKDIALKELRDQLAMKQQGAGSGAEKQNFWESSSFKVVVSISILILVVFAKQ